MSISSKLYYDIQEMYIEGYKPFTIAAALNIDIDLVYEWIEREHIAQGEFDPYETINS